MSRLDKLSTKALIRLWIEAENRKQLFYFNSLNPDGGRYSSEQKEYAIEKATTIGVRATSRLLHVPRRTIQRWLRVEGITVKRCPDWIYDWAYWRRKRREKWERIMSYYIILATTLEMTNLPFLPSFSLIIVFKNGYE